MPELKIDDTHRRHYSKHYLIIHDDTIKKFTGDDTTTIALSPHMVRDGLVCAVHPVIADRIDTEARTYQELEDRLQVAEVSQASIQYQLRKVKAEKIELQHSLDNMKQSQRKSELEAINWQAALDKLQDHYDTMPFHERFKFLLGG